PTSRNRAAIPNTFATTATAPKKSASGTAIEDGRSASAAPAARKIDNTPRAPASSEPDQSSSADMAARERGDAKSQSSASATASQSDSASRWSPENTDTPRPDSSQGARRISDR